MKASKRSSGTGWVIGSLLLHVLLLGFAATRHARVSTPAASSARPMEVEVEVVPAPSALDRSEKQDVAEQGTALATPTADKVAHGSAAAVVTDDEAAPEGDATAPGDSSDDAAEGTDAPSSAPHLGLAQLGLTDTNLFVDRSPQAAPDRPRGKLNVKRRLDRALAQGIVNQESAAGRGAGSPVIRSLESVVYASSAPLNGNARFTFVIDSDGKLVSSSLGNASSDRDKWERVARETAQALSQRKLPVPKGQSVRLTVEVTSHLELPSGADPGLEVRALGIPLKKGGGDRSTRIDILNPLNPTAPLSLMGDPADIAAKARRMVHAHVVSEELL